MLGVVLSVGAGLAFAVSSIFTAVGMRERKLEDGLLIMLVVNLFMLSGLIIAFGFRPVRSAGALVAFALGGIFGSVAGRAANLRAIRILGPSRSAIFMSGAPASAAVFGWLILNESISLLDAFGACIVIASFLVLVADDSSLNATDAVDTTDRRPDLQRLTGYAIAGFSPILFGLAFVLRKLGLQTYPDALVGALVGVIAGLFVVLIKSAALGQVKDQISSEILHASPWFLAAGGATTVALISQFLAFQHLPAWQVSLVQGTQVIWTAILAAIFLRREERISARLIVSIIGAFVGAALVVSTA